MKRKLVVVINGKGGVGKDTFCDFVSEKYSTLNISTITPVKEIARRYGWSGEKDKKSRKFLADLKRIFIEYNDLPNSYAFQEYKKFLEGDKEIMFVDIRECKEIREFCQRVRKDASNCREMRIEVTSLLIHRSGIDSSHEDFGNDADDHVEDYQYEYSCDNNGSLDEFRQASIEQIDRMIADKFPPLVS